eukprot:6941003-Pyramimonas_sp.AAC.1
MGEDVYAAPPSGEGEPHVARQLRKALYGTRGTSKLLQHAIRMLVTVVFYRVQKGIYIAVHGDDFMAVGALEDLRWLNEILEAKFE